MTNNASTSLSGSTKCICTEERLKYFPCLCGAQAERDSRGGLDPRFSCDQPIGETVPEE